MPRISPEDGRSEASGRPARRPSVKREAAVEAVFVPVRPPTTFEETVERLGTAIRVGLLAPGSKLPPERRLAEELRISRSTVRLALAALIESGHLISIRGRYRRRLRSRAAAAARARRGPARSRRVGPCSITASRSRPAP